MTLVFLQPFIEYFSSYESNNFKVFLVYIWKELGTMLLFLLRCSLLAMIAPAAVQSSTRTLFLDFVDKNLNNAWYNKALSLIGKPHLAISTSSVIFFWINFSHGCGCHGFRNHLTAHYYLIISLISMFAFAGFQTSATDFYQPRLRRCFTQNIVSFN